MQLVQEFFQVGLVAHQQEYRLTMLISGFEEVVKPFGDIIAERVLLQPKGPKKSAVNLSQYFGYSRLAVYLA